MKNPRVLLKEALYFKNKKKEAEIERLLLDLIKGPVFKYVSFGLTAAILARFAKKAQGDYPEVSEFINQNLGLIEEKLNSLKTTIHKNEIPQKV
jgi:hypothetical protein